MKKKPKIGYELLVITLRLFLDVAGKKNQLDRAYDVLVCFRVRLREIGRADLAAMLNTDFQRVETK